MDIELTASEIITAAQYADLFQQNKTKQMANGIVRNNKRCRQSNFGVHYIGLLGEVAISRLLGIAMRTDVTIAGDGDCDMVCNGNTIQIKTTSFGNANNTGRFIIFNHLQDFSTDYAILCSTKNAHTIHISGYTSRQNFLENIVTKNFGYGIRYCLAESNLKPIAQFKQELELQTEII